MIADKTILKTKLPDGFRHTAYEEVNSTNSICLELAQSGDAGNHWVTAANQSSGKGSRGRTWESLSGNLFASLLLKNPSEVKLLATLTFVASLAIRDTVISVVGEQTIDVSLKWPNDVLLDGKKLSGILLENHQLHSDNMVIVGIGINVLSSPEHALFPATCLLEAGIEVDVAALFLQLVHHMQMRIEQWNCGLGFESIKGDWLKHCAKLGEHIQVKQSNKTLDGVFEGLSDDGRLMLRTNDNQTHKISTADIFFA